MNSLQVIHLSNSDFGGGAAIAAYRIHSALCDQGIDSCLGVNRAVLGDPSVISPNGNFLKGLALSRGQLGRLFAKVLRTKNPIIHSPCILPSRWVDYVNNSDVDLVHLHWVAGEMLSIKDISRIQKPIVWTFHDTWAFSGAEHVFWDERWRDGYYAHNRPLHESGFDLNKWTWNRKRKYWRRALQIVAPSNWMAECVRQSSLMSNWPVEVIPNCLNMDNWRPVDQKFSRDVLQLPQSKKLVLFGSHGANSAPHKGFDLLVDGLRLLDSELCDMEIVVFGQMRPIDGPDLGFPTRYTGHLSDELSMRMLLSAVDLVVVPSRQDNLPNVAVEAISVGTPVVAFKIGGLPDIVTHGVSGYLANPFDVADLAKGIEATLCADLRAGARMDALDKFSSKSTAKKYVEVYRSVLNR